MNGTTQVDNRSVSRRRWRIGGRVQGVGFRPFVYRLAVETGLTGFVRNDAAGVVIEAQGPEDRLDEFAARLVRQRPALAEVKVADCQALPAQADEGAFVICRSDDEGEAAAEVTIDTAVCAECLAEMFNPAERRYRYPLINCTNCGPRYSIIRRIPYDRPNTTMAGFGMCPQCAAEYADPLNRRFHAQPTACHRCGPRAALVDARGRPMEGDPVEAAADMLLRGQILAVKGLGGFHLAVRADREEPVRRLRMLKRRDAKPFAIMCADIAQAQQLAALSAAAVRAMLSPVCPIVLAARRDGALVATAVAPGMHRLGVMLPYTPLQHLLVDALKRRCAGRMPPLVMTSANVSDEPLVIDNDEALRRLGGMCDGLLWHDRPIERPVDDSVLIDMPSGDGDEQQLLPVRRARGYVPASLELPADGGEGICVGGELKNTVAVVRGRRVILSHHLGDLTHAAAYEGFRRALRDMQDLFAVRPGWVAHDLHPLYLSTAAAREMAAAGGLAMTGVQHHHAHAAAVMCEHGIAGPVLAVVCDGTGYGTDGTIWGGELLLADLCDFRRLGGLVPIRLPGGDAAARDCRRAALGVLRMALGEAFAEHPAVRRLVPDDEERAFLLTMMRNDVNCPLSSGAGRLFDAVAAILGVCLRNSFEAQAGMTLEALAAGAGDGGGDGGLFRLEERGGLVRLDTGPLICAIVSGRERGEDAALLAALFHRELAGAWEAAVVRAAERTSLDTVVLSGGVFCNAVLTDQLSRRLRRHGLRVLRHGAVPPGDGGLSLGQAAVASARRAAGWPM